MSRYFIKRIILLLPTLLAILLAVFVLLNITNPRGFNSFGIHSLGYEEGTLDLLDKAFDSAKAGPTLINKYLRYCYNLLIHGEFGTSDSIFDVNYEIFFRLRVSLVLAGFGFLISLLVGIPLGVSSALKGGSRTDRIISTGTLVAASIPSYTLAVIVMVIFTVKLRWLPLSGLSSWQSYIMPIMVIASAGIALTVKMTRSAVLDVINRQYITVLHAKGLSEKDIIFKHILKNSFVTIASTLNNLAAQLLCGTLIAENFFAFPGIGQLVFRSVSQGQQYVLLGTVAVLSVLLMSFNIFFDLVCGLISPQIRAEYSRK